ESRAGVAAPGQHGPARDTSVSDPAGQTVPGGVRDRAGSHRAPRRAPPVRSRHPGPAKGPQAPGRHGAGGGTMRSNTQSVSIDARPEHVFDFVANPENLPRWAVGFARSITRVGDDWVVETANGPVSIHYVTDPGLGVVDFHFSPAPGVDLAAYSRVGPNGDGAEYQFPELQPPGLSDEAFAGQIEALGEELVVLRSIFKAQSACRR